MATTQSQFGSQAATVGTEHFLVTDNTTAGVYEFVAETDPSARGDYFELRAYEKATAAGDTRQVIETWYFSNDQAANERRQFVSPSYMLLNGWSYTLKQIAGTGRTIQWSVRKTGTPTQHNSGSQAATVGTEHFLGTDPDTTAGAFQYGVDLSVLARGDTLEMRVYEKVNDSTDTAYELDMWRFDGVQGNHILWLSPCFQLINGWRYSLKQTAGTSRTFKWTIRKAG